ncbi:MAG: D-alanyl-D-alanine carboxypeptidase family protein [Hyphomicrobiaceae bacterium]|nr:D-alanyl-D-alanine carboxypeptidase family protein [Hyphomicrobiaceae bacterium]
MRPGIGGHLAAVATLALCLMRVAPSGAEANPVILFEPATGQVLYAEDPDRLWHPASVTKMMTAYLTFEAVRSGKIAWDAEVPISEYARSQPATRIGLRGGIKINVEQAVRGLILRSANDFATAIAERIGGTEGTFVQQMNETAARLGMSRTRFKNPHGLPDPEQVTTARDMAILTAALLKDFPDRAEVFSTPTVQIHKGTFHSQNDLLRTLEGGDGMKTGFTCASGYNVVASATRKDRRLVAVVLGAANRTTRSERAAQLIEAGFAHLEGKSDPQPAGGAAGNGLPVPLQPVALKDLPVSPADPASAYDMSRETRTRKCGNSERIVRRAPKALVKAPAGDGGRTAQQIVTGSVAPPRRKPVAKSAEPTSRAPVIARTPVKEEQGDGH